MSVQVIGGSLVWRGGMQIDADGSPRAYNIDSGKGLDRLANAGEPGHWFGVACNASGVPVTQGPNDPAPGFMVSTTSLVDHSKAASDPARYVDSSSVPYLSIARDLLTYGCRLGDVAMVFYGSAECGAVVADVGPPRKYGEGSIALAEALGIPSAPRNGGVSSPVVSYVVFAGSARGWPRTVFDFQAQAHTLFTAWGGLERLAEVLG